MTRDDVLHLVRKRIAFNAMRVGSPEFAEAWSEGFLAGESDRAAGARLGDPDTRSLFEDWVAMRPEGYDPDYAEVAWRAFVLAMSAARSRPGSCAINCAAHALDSDVWYPMGALSDLERSLDWAGYEPCSRDAATVVAFGLPEQVEHVALRVADGWESKMGEGPILTHATLEDLASFGEEIAHYRRRA